MEMISGLHIDRILVVVGLVMLIFSPMRLGSQVKRKMKLLAYFIVVWLPIMAGLCWGLCELLPTEGGMIPSMTSGEMFDLELGPELI